MKTSGFAHCLKYIKWVIAALGFGDCIGIHPQKKKRRKCKKQGLYMLKSYQYISLYTIWGFGDKCCKYIPIRNAIIDILINTCTRIYTLYYREYFQKTSPNPKIEKKAEKRRLYMLKSYG